MSYREKYPVGSTVQVADEQTLRRFKASWSLHHPLADEQIQFAGRHAIVSHIGFYHGGDVLYELVGIPGTWHEECLRAEGDSLGR